MFNPRCEKSVSYAETRYPIRQFSFGVHDSSHVILPGIYLHSLTNHHDKQAPASAHSETPFIDYLGISWRYILEQI